MDKKKADVHLSWVYHGFGAEGSQGIKCYHCLIYSMGTLRELIEVNNLKEKNIEEYSQEEEQQMKKWNYMSFTAFHIVTKCNNILCIPHCFFLSLFLPNTLSTNLTW